MPVALPNGVRAAGPCQRTGDGRRRAAIRAEGAGWEGSMLVRPGSRSRRWVRDYMIWFTTPPSTRIAAPVVADAAGLHRYTARLATSSAEAKRFSNEVGR